MTGDHYYKLKRNKRTNKTSTNVEKNFELEGKWSIITITVKVLKHTGGVTMEHNTERSLNRFRLYIKTIVLPG